MNALAKPPVRMTVDEFLDWEPQDGRKWQLVDGEPQAMAPASPTHAFLQAELTRMIGNHLVERRSPCRAAVEPGIVPRVLASHNVRIPDVAVTCIPGDGDDGRILSYPVLVIEILSPSNQPETWYNVWAYTSIPAVQEILVLHSTGIGADLLRRDADGTWPSVPAAVASGDLVLDSIGFRAPLASIYRITRLRAGG
jgi:Uma2 family endonuclease